MERRKLLFLLGCAENALFERKFYKEHFPSYSKEKLNDIMLNKFEFLLGEERMEICLKEDVEKAIHKQLEAEWMKCRENWQVSDHYICSNCTFDDFTPSNFCPNCGSKMTMEGSGN